MFTNLLAPKWQKDSDLGKWEETGRQNRNSSNVGKEFQCFKSPAAFLML